MTDDTQAKGEGSGCVVNGCLYGAVALFAILLVGMLVPVAVRFSTPPEPRQGPQAAPFSESGVNHSPVFLAGMLGIAGDV
jgi:hypothetical protein